MAKKLSLKDRFDKILENFKPTTNIEWSWGEFENGTRILKQNRINIPENLYINNPHIAFIIFVYLKKFEFSGIDEKVAWTIPIEYKGILFFLTHRKFGFSIISNEDGEDITEKGIEAIRQINKAIPYAEKIFEPKIKSLVELGNITLDNQYHLIRSRYKFFRSKAQIEFTKAEKNKGNFKHKTKKLKGKGADSVTTITDISLKYNVSGNNYSTAMLDAYFCLLEHIFVLIIPYHPSIKNEDITLADFISLNWKDKLKKVISLKESTQAMKLYEKLLYIKEELRNPLTHGYFLKQDHSFYVHVKYLGAIPMSLRYEDNHLRYALSLIKEYTFSDICSVFDDFDLFLKEYEKTKYGIQFIETGLPIAYDDETRNENLEAMKSKEDFQEYINYVGYRYERAINMDW